MPMATAPFGIFGAEADGRAPCEMAAIGGSDQYDGIVDTIV